MIPYLILPATLFYGVVMSNLPVGFLGVFLFYSKSNFISPGLVVIKLRKYRLSDFGITTNGLKLSLLLFLPPFLTWNQKTSLVPG